MPHETDVVRRFDWRGEAFPEIRVRSDAGWLYRPDHVELPLAAWRRRAQPQPNVITLRIPSWASSNSKP
jgi:hypothetical protein